MGFIKCEKCGSEISDSQLNCSICNEKLDIKNRINGYERSEKNIISIACTVIGSLIVIFGTVCSLSIATIEIGYTSSFDESMFFIILFPSIFCGALLIGIGEIIAQLQILNDKTMEKMNE